MKWLTRYSEFFGWAPLIILLCVVSWILFGALDPRLSPDRMGLLLDLPVFAAYALVASGIAYQIWRRWSMRLTGEQLDDLWNRLLAGERGAMLVYAINAVWYVITLCLLLAFFWPAR